MLTRTNMLEAISDLPMTETLPSKHFFVQKENKLFFSKRKRKARKNLLRTGLSVKVKVNAEA